MQNKSKGITLIALVITIIVLLILAGVAIATLTGDNGVLTKAVTAKENTEKAEVIENAKLDILGIQSDKNGKLTTGDLKGVLDIYFKDVPEKITVEDIATMELATKDGKYKIKVSEIYNGRLFDDNKIQFEPGKLEIGEPSRAGQYGWKVGKYRVTAGSSSTGIWRLYYQDSEYTYLITDRVDTEFDSERFKTYQSGADVSPVGAALNPMVNSFFTSSNTTEGVRLTAYLTDTEYYKAFTNEDCLFAIAGPSVELLAASFNSQLVNGSGSLIPGTEEEGYYVAWELVEYTRCHRNIRGGNSAFAQRILY